MKCEYAFSIFHGQQKTKKELSQRSRAITYSKQLHTQRHYRFTIISH